MKKLFISQPMKGKSPEEIQRERDYAIETAKITLDIDEICKELINGKLYLAERAVRKLLCRVFHYLNIKHPDTGKEFTIVSLKKVLDEEYSDFYRTKVYELSRCDNFERQTVDLVFRQILKGLLEKINPQLGDVFASLPELFLEEPISGA